LIWYQRAFDGRGSNARELIPLTWGFVARYFWLVGLASIPISIVVVPLAITKLLAADSLRSLDGRLGLNAYLAVVQIVGTFMVPALAFSTRRVTKAVPVGLRMITQFWPANWKYVVIPGFVTAALASVYWLAPSLSRPALEILTTLISLVFAGAIARYYLRTTTTTESLDSGTVTG
jgi:hypothetical protein